LPFIFLPMLTIQVQLPLRCFWGYMVARLSSGLGTENSLRKSLRKVND
jgi:hypothetical protein